MARSRFRSVRYDLSAAVEVARLVESAGETVAADILAPALGYSGTNNGAYLARGWRTPACSGWSPDGGPASR